MLGGIATLGVAGSIAAGYLLLTSFQKPVSPTPLDGTILTYRGRTNEVRTVAWSPGGESIASGGADDTVQVWDASTGGHLYTYHGYTS